MTLPFPNRAATGPALAQPPPVATPAEARRQAYLQGVWTFLAVLTPLCGFLGARGFAPTVGAAGLLCLPLARPRNRDLAGLILVALLVEWALLSALWSPAPLPRSLHDFGRFTGFHLAQQVVLSGALIVTARMLSPAAAAKVLSRFAVGLAALVAVLLVEGLSGAVLFQSVQPLIGKTVRPDIAVRSVDQGAYVLSILFWPTVVALWRQGLRPIAGLFALAAGVDLTLLHVAAPAFALLASGGVFVLAYWGGRGAALGCGLFAAVQTLATPWLMRGWAEGGMFQGLRPHLPASWAARVDIWTFTSARMVEKPLFGWGLDASRMFKDKIPLHPHDGALQLWFELGLPGAVLGALVWAFVFWRFAEASRRSRLFAAAGCATATVCLVISAFSFSLWQEWWICLSALAFAACVVLGRRLGGAGDA